MGDRQNKQNNIILSSINNPKAYGVGVLWQAGQAQSLPMTYLYHQHLHYYTYIIYIVKEEIPRR